MNRVRKIICVSVLAFLVTPAMAEDYELDTVHTQIHFSVSHLGFSNSHGSFSDFDGTFSFDPEAPDEARVEVTIQTESLDMDDATWNEHLKGEQWFNVAEHKTMRFRSTSVEQVETDQFEVAGNLTLLGVSKPMTLNVALNKIGMQMGSPKAGFSATATIDRTDWGMTQFAPMVGADVSISIEIEGGVASANPETRMQRIVPPKVNFYKNEDIITFSPDEFIKVQMIITQSGLVSQTRIKKGGFSPHHNHPEEETIVLISGSLKAMTPDGDYILEPGDAINIEPYAEHQLEALEDAFFVEAFGPGRVLVRPNLGN